MKPSPLQRLGHDKSGAILIERALTVIVFAATLVLALNRTAAVLSDAHGSLSLLSASTTQNDKLNRAHEPGNDGQHFCDKTPIRMVDQ
ncbi:hypothetical protein [Bradyrhizobium sp. ORS 111]|uniref:hypothetical protein n=1 Tax=Bradyrhizobium sp. ORS 111 TaxID=1685958 RepID=UPI0038903470